MSTLQRLEDLPLPPAPAGDHLPPKWRDAPLYLPDRELVEALEVAMALGHPLFLTGDPGCGKTSAAYWVAWRMGLAPEDLFVEQVRSDATAARIRYEFDAVKYFRESQAAVARHEPWIEDRRRFIREGTLWNVFQAARERPVMLLLDEIDKAPRDFPNDLLREFDELLFEVPDLPKDHPERFVRARGGKGALALVVFTSNGERQLPDAFLRRCVHHHLQVSPEWIARVVRHRINDIKIAPTLVDLAVKRFVALQGVPGLRHRPGLAEFIVWLRIVALSGGIAPDRLEAVRLAELPYLGTLLKSPEDRALLAQRAG